MHQKLPATQHHTLQHLQDASEFLYLNDEEVIQMMTNIKTDADNLI